MTFIVAIQLSDSILISVDNKEVTLDRNGTTKEKDALTSKLHPWNNGIITGTGESYIIQRIVTFFKEFVHSKLNSLPDCLELSRQIREHEIGVDHFQVKNTKLLCSSYSDSGAQLYKVERFDEEQAYTIMAVEPMNITVWMFNPNVEAISADLQNLYADLKNYATFTNKADWINYYINRLAPIYQKQSQQDSLMSQSFDFFFQMKDEYITGHIPNIHNVPIKFKEISTK